MVVSSVISHPGAPPSCDPRRAAADVRPHVKACADAADRAFTNALSCLEKARAAERIVDAAKAATTSTEAFAAAAALGAPVGELKALRGEGERLAEVTSAAFAKICDYAATWRAAPGDARAADARRLADDAHEQTNRAADYCFNARELYERVKRMWQDKLRDAGVDVPFKSEGRRATKVPLEVLFGVGLRRPW